MPRHKYTLDLTRYRAPERARDTGRNLRHPTAGDDAVLAALMLDAYRGTIDYDGETLEDARSEVRSFFEGRSGDPCRAGFILIE